MIEYVLGFARDPKANTALLIRKNRPSWQAGLCNGVGGKVEPGETPEQAMPREALEEAALDAQWRRVAVMLGTGYRVHVFAADADLSAVRTCTDEEVLQIPLEDIYLRRRTDVLSNVPWLLGLIEDTEIAGRVVVDYTGLRAA